MGGEIKLILSDKHLKELAKSSKIVDPFIPENCEGATINLTLDTQIKKYKFNNTMVMGEKISEEHMEKVDISKEEFYLEPNQSVLVQAIEEFSIPTNMVAIILERYSIKLLGLVVSPASYMNPGYWGRLSFLVTNHSPASIRLVPGVKFCQLYLSELSSEADKPYNKQDGKYSGSKDVHISKLHLDKEIQDFLKENGLGEISKDYAKQLGEYLLNEMDLNAQRYVDIIQNEISDL